MSEKLVKAFFEFIYDRHLIWYRRFVKKEDPPWTNDPILQKMHFCNVYRELDKGTQHLVQNVIDTDLEPSTKLFNIIAYRFFNLYGFFGNHFPEPVEPEEFEWKDYEKRFDEILESGGRLFNPAYLISQAKYDRSYRPSNKHVQILLILKDLAKNIDSYTHSVTTSPNAEYAFNKLQEIKFIGPFLAYEIFCDLCYTDWFPFTEDDFVNVGPGAHWGLKIMYDKPHMKDKEAPGYCISLREEQSKHWRQLKEETGKDWNDIYYRKSYVSGPELSLRGIEHSLCEYRKYNRICAGKGKRRLYKK